MVLWVWYIRYFKHTPDSKPYIKHKLSFHTELYIKQKFDAYFKFLYYIERGIADYQDAVVLEKK